MPPPGYSLSPLALGNQTGNEFATTDRLIVAARHSDVNPLKPAFARYYCTQTSPCTNNILLSSIQADVLLGTVGLI